MYDDVDASQEIYDRYYQRNSKYENLGCAASGQFHEGYINHFTRQSLVNLGAISGLDMVRTSERDAVAGRDKKHPNIYMLYKKCGQEQGTVGIPSKPCRQVTACDNQSLKQYIEISKAAMQKHKGKIKEWIEQKEKIIVWGIGAFSLHYFKKGLGECNIIAIVDSDPKKQGLVIYDIKVESPDVIRDGTATIVIAAALF